MSADDREAFVPATMTGREFHNMAGDLFPGAISAAESRGRAAGWREAIEALRDVQRYLDWDSESRFLGHPLLTDNQMLTAISYLESLAPKETP